jgi:DNA-binding transcriptional LysR family regulator
VVDFDLRLFRYFITLVDKRSFTDAAAELHVTQSALSQGIQRLETVFGARLIERSPKGSTRGLTLSTAGETLYPAARDVLLHAERALKMAQNSAAQVSIGVGYGTNTPRDLTRVALEVSGQLGHVDVALVYIPWGQELEHLLRGDVDLLFLQVAQGFTDARLESVALRSVRRVAVFRSGHRLADREEVSMRDLSDEPIVDAASDRDYWIVNPRPDRRTPFVVGPPARTVDEMLTMVSAGRGMAITSASVAENNGNSQLSFVPITDLDAATVVLARNSRDRRPAVAALFRAIAEAGHTAA